MFKPSGTDMKKINLGPNRYSKPEEYSIVEVPLPELREEDILVSGDGPENDDDDFEVRR